MVTNMETNELTAERIAELRKLLPAVGVLPLRADVSPGGPSGAVCRNEAIMTASGRLFARFGEQRGNRWFFDANFLAEAANALRPMLDEIERLRADNKRLQEALRRMTECAEARK